MRDYAFDGIVTIYNEDAAREGILRLLSAELGGTFEDDSVFIFWAGHALTRKTAGRGDIGYLVPYDGTFDEAEMSFRNVSMTTIKEDIARSIPAKHIFFVVDACMSGILLTRGVEPSPKTRSLDYLRNITKEEVRQILVACKADQWILDGGPRGHSVFTRRFIEALEEATDFVTATEIRTRVSEEVFLDAAARGHAQLPHGGKLSGLGDYVFVPTQVEIAVLQSLLLGVRVELQSRRVGYGGFRIAGDVVTLRVHDPASLARAIEAIRNMVVPGFGSELVVEPVRAEDTGIVVTYLLSKQR